MVNILVLGDLWEVCVHVCVSVRMEGGGGVLGWAHMFLFITLILCFPLYKVHTVV